MTDTPVRSDVTDPIDLGPDLPSDDLERQADAILEQADPSGPRTLRQAIRQDAVAARDLSRDRATRLRADIAAEPIRATFYALGIGVVVGLLLRR